MKSFALVFSFTFVLLASFGLPAAEPDPRIAELQEGLAELGYDPGPVDGLLGPKTRAAITEFQRDQKMPVDQEYSDILENLDILELMVDSERQRAPQRDALLAMSDDELIEFIERSSEEEAERISWLIPERFADLPIRLLLDKWLPPDAGDVVIYIALRQLLYPPSREGVKQFQADIGAEATGELTGRQLMELHRRWMRQRDTPVYAGGSVRVYMNDDSGWAEASGTWIAEDEEVVAPINAVKITCDRERRECLRVTAELFVPSLDDDNSLLYLGRDADGYHLQLFPIRRYRIISWSGGEIVAHRGGSESCFISELTLNRNINQVYEVSTNVDTPACRDPERRIVAKPEVARLAPGWKTMREFWRKRQEVTSAYLNPRVAEEMKQVWGAAEAFGLPSPPIEPSDATR